MSSFLKKSYGKDLEKKDLSLKGWNWGKADFVGNIFLFTVNIIHVHCMLLCFPPQSNQTATTVQFLGWLQNDVSI